MFISVMLSFINTDNIDRVSGRLLEHTPHLLDLAFGGGGKLHGQRRIHQGYK